MDAEQCLIDLGYQVEIPRDPIYTDDPAVKRAYRLRFSHDPLHLVKPMDSSIAPGLLLEIHQPINFKRLDMQTILDASICDQSKKELRGYYGPSVVDTFIISSWHIFHHGVILPDRVWPYLVRLKQCADWWRAYIKCFTETSLATVLNRVEQTRSMDMVRFAAQRIVELFQYVGEPVPNNLLQLNLEVQRRLGSGDQRLSRLLESKWRYGDYSTSFWQYAFDAHSAVRRIQQEALIHRHTIEWKYSCPRYPGERHSMVVLDEPPFNTNHDRLRSHIYEGGNVVDGLPYVAWGLGWTPSALHLHVEIKSIKAIINDFDGLPPRYADMITIYITSDSQSAAFSFSLRPQGLAVYRRKPTFEKLESLEAKVEINDDSLVHISAVLPSSLLSFRLSEGTTFGFGIRYTDHASTERINTVLSWPSGVLRYGMITCVE